MDNPKLWWLVSHSDNSFKYELHPYEDAAELDILNEVHIVHPSNPAFPKELRNHNRSFIDHISAIRASRIRHLISIDAPDVVIANEADNGMMARFFNPFGKDNE